MCLCITICITVVLENGSGLLESCQEFCGEGVGLVISMSFLYGSTLSSGRFVTMMTALEDESDAYTTVFPIPSRAIDLNPALKQNPGYMK